MTEKCLTTPIYFLYGLVTLIYDLWPPNCYHVVLLSTFIKFGRDRIKNDRVIESESRWEKNNNNTQKTEQKQKGLRLRRQTLIIHKRQNKDEVGQTLIIHKRQNNNIKVCRRSRADLHNSKEGTAESVKGQRAVAPLTLITIGPLSYPSFKPLYKTPPLTILAHETAQTHRKSSSRSFDPFSTHNSMRASHYISLNAWDAINWDFWAKFLNFIKKYFYMMCFQWKNNI